MGAQTCLRCGASVEPEDTVCFTCGAPIGDTKTPTQPVNVPRQPRPAVPARATAEAPAIVAAPAAVSAPASRPRSAVPARPLDARSAGATPGNRWALLLLGAVVVALLAAGAGLALRATLAAPPVASTSVYTARNLFRFDRPALWSATPLRNGVLLADSGGTSTVRITAVAVSLSQTAQSEATAIATATPGLLPAPEVRIGDQTWQQLSGQLTGSDGATRQIVEYVTIRDSELYTIECSCPLSSYTSTNTLVFQPLLASFAFL
ncbi:MAG TPA: hypothetical protein VFY89_08720 [Ktedonobacterales bacterium]